MKKSSQTFDVLPLGSFALGVHSKGGDVDALCVSPLPAAKFFKEMPSTLLAQEKRVTLVRVRVSRYLTVKEVVYSSIFAL